MLADKKRREKVDPWLRFELQYPDGSPVNGEIHEMRRSEALKLNQGRMFLYMASQRARADKIALWERATAAAEKQSADAWKMLQKRAAEASTAEIPLPDTKASADLLAYRQANVAEVSRPESRPIPRPNLAYGDNDALWIRVHHSGGAGVIKHYDN